MNCLFVRLSCHSKEENSIFSPSAHAQLLPAFPSPRDRWGPPRAVRFWRFFLQGWSLMRMRYFPIFADLQGADVLVVGGGEQAAQKVRLLRKTRARITVVAETVTDE